MSEISVDAYARTLQNKDITLHVRRIDGPGIFRQEDQPSESDTEKETDWQPRREARKTRKYQSQLTSLTWGTVDLLPPSVYDLASAVRTRLFAKFVHTTRPPSVLVSAPKPMPSHAKDTTARQDPGLESVAQCEHKEAKVSASGYTQFLRCGTQFDQGDLCTLFVDWMQSRLQTECLGHRDEKWAQAFGRDQKKRFLEFVLGDKGGSSHSSPGGTTPQASPRGSVSHGSPHGSGSSSRGSPYSARATTPLQRSPRGSVSQGSPLRTSPKRESDPTTPSRSGRSTPRRPSRTLLPAPPSAPAPPTVLSPIPIHADTTYLDMAPPSLQVPMRPRAPSSPDNIKFLNSPMFLWRPKMGTDHPYPVENVLATDTHHSAAGVIPPWDTTGPPSIEDVVKFSIWATDTIANHKNDSEEPFTIHCQLPPANRTISIPGKDGGDEMSIEGGSRFSLIRRGGLAGSESFLTEVEMVPDDTQDIQTYREECAAQARAVQAYWEDVREVLDEHPETYQYGFSTLFPPKVGSRPPSAGSSHGSTPGAP